SAEKRSSKHNTFKAYYTFSKALEGANEAAANGATGMQDATKLYLEKGRTNSDRRHRFVMSTIWNIDYFNGSSPLLRGALNHWVLSGIVSAKSGPPFTVLSGRDNNLDGVNNDRADLIGNPKLNPNPSPFYPTTLFFTVQ